MCITFIASQGEGTFFKLVGVSIDASTSIKKYFSDSHVPAAGCLHQRRVSILVVVFNVGATVQQHFDDLFVATATGVHQGGIA